MQNRYAGDVGDFGKFSLLRSLFGRDTYRLGVIWYLYPDENHNDDGGHINYLDNSDYQKCDRLLCNKLSTVIQKGRSVPALERAKLLPKTTVYFSAMLDFHINHPAQTQEDKHCRDALRKQWLGNAVSSVKDCNAVFLDPDNGLQIASCPKKSRMKAGKYAFYDEIVTLFKGKDVCVIYHHLNRHINHGTHENQIKTRAKELLEKVKPEGGVFALRFTPFSPRAYFILTNDKNAAAIEKSIKDFMQGSCGAHWDSYFESTKKLSHLTKGSGSN